MQMRQIFMIGQRRQIASVRMAPVIRGDEHQRVHAQQVEKESGAHLSVGEGEFGHEIHGPFHRRHLSKFALPFGRPELAERVDGGFVFFFERFEVEQVVRPEVSGGGGGASRNLAGGEVLHVAHFFVQLDVVHLEHLGSFDGELELSSVIVPFHFERIAFGAKAVTLGHDDVHYGSGRWLLFGGDRCARSGGLGRVCRCSGRRIVR
mmetsp:Transcript_5782/g.12231  ORF Transcript_5782/g.12231 Transcript_5782/m.12231 type:complete len:206 (-) Transcript_5782:1767-2384(-)